MYKKYLQTIIVLAASGVLVISLIAYFSFSLGSLAAEEDSIFVVVTDSHIEVSFSPTGESMAWYDLPKQIPLDSVLGASSDIPVPKNAGKIAGTGSKELRSGSFSTDRGEGAEYWFIKDFRYPILTVNLQDQKYDRMVLEIRDADEIAEKIREKLSNKKQ